MGKTNTRLEAARAAYREALEATRVRPTPENWAKLLAAGKELSSAQETRSGGSRRSRRVAPPVTINDLDEGPSDGPVAEPTEVRELD